MKVTRITFPFTGHGPAPVTWTGRCCLMWSGQDLIGIGSGRTRLAAFLQAREEYEFLAVTEAN